MQRGEKELRKADSRVAILAVLLLIVSSASTAGVGLSSMGMADALPTLQMNPSYIVVTNTSSPFSLDVTVSNITDLYAWQVAIYFENTKVNIVGATQGDFLSPVNSTTWVPTWNNNYNSTHGEVTLYCTLESPISGVSGTGTLATIIFQVVGGGNATLHFDTSNTLLLDSSRPWHNPIPYVTIDGSVNVPGFHNVAVNGISPLKTIVGKGYAFNVTVTFANLGTSTETFNSTIYLNTISVSNQTITLANGTMRDITFVVPTNTSSISVGNYSLSAFAQPVPGETVISDNTFVYGMVKVTIPGDINGDFKVSLVDLVFLANAYGTTPASGGTAGAPHAWNPYADIDNSGAVGLTDLVILALHYGQSTG